MVIRAYTSVWLTDKLSLNLRRERSGESRITITASRRRHFQLAGNRVRQAKGTELCCCCLCWMMLDAAGCRWLPIYGIAAVVVVAAAMRCLRNAHTENSRKTCNHFKCPHKCSPAVDWPLLILVLTRAGPTPHFCCFRRSTSLCRGSAADTQSPLALKHITATRTAEQSEATKVAFT